MNRALSLARHFHPARASIAIAPVAHNASQEKETDERAGHRPGSSLRCRFFPDLPDLDLRTASECARTLPSLSIYRQRVSWYNLLKRPLATHLRDTVESNKIASKFEGPRGSNPPSTYIASPNLLQRYISRHFQPSTVLLAKSGSSW